MLHCVSIGCSLVSCSQDIGLFSTFRGLCHSLWHLWELAITGQPIIVVGTKPELVGDAVLAIVSLISPLVFSGDYRPFFSLYDPDFKEVRGPLSLIAVHKPIQLACMHIVADCVSSRTL